MKWKADQMTEQTGKLAVVTGSNTGTGDHIAHGLASKGATVIMACRNLEKAEAARQRIMQEVPQGDVHVEHLDLADLKSVTAFSEAMKRKHAQIDLLINNAGVMIPPQSITKDGFELQFGTNHLGHFALTGHLMPLLEQAGKARVITMSSIAHHGGSIDFNDLQGERKKYKKWAMYSQSKLANLLFALELDRRLKAAGSSITSLGSHPGWSATELQRHSSLFRFLNYIFAMAPVKGAAPTLYAATVADASDYPYWGVTKRGESVGWPGKAKISSRASDKASAQRLWKISCELTGLTYLD